MKQRNPFAVFFFGLITIGLYSWYWLVKTKGEMNSLGQKIPTAWIWLIPIIGGIWWLWKYSEGVESVSKGQTSGILSFIVLFFLGCIGQAIIQDSFNKLSPTTSSTQPAGPLPSAPDQNNMTPPPPPPAAPNPPAPQSPQPPLVGG